MLEVIEKLLKKLIYGTNKWAFQLIKNIKN